MILFTIMIAGKAQSDSSSLQPTSGILYSRIGYNLHSDKRILIRSSSNKLLRDNEKFVLQDLDGNSVFTGIIKYWGRKWNEYYWIADFSMLNDEGLYQFEIKDYQENVIKTKPFKIQNDVLWKDTWKIVSLFQLDGRINMRNENIKKHGLKYAQGGGWQDCGSYLREVNSHATMLIGLFDILEYSGNRITKDDKDKIIEQIIIGLEYISFCQDKARDLGKGEGAIIHEWPKHTNVITGDVVKGALCFARAYFLLSGIKKDKANDYLERTERSYQWLDENGPIHNSGGTDFHGNTQPNDGFNPIVYGASKDFVRPEEWKTRDILMMMWVALELTKSGKIEYKEKSSKFARMLMERQIPSNQPEVKYYGHFRSFKSCDFTEKAWEHHHMGYDAGATFPHYIIPMIQMVKLWSDHKDIKLWDSTIRNFAYGYFLPACFNNPFYLLPMGYFKGEGLLNFSGLWHGMNGAYGSAAALAMELARYTNDERFEKIAIGNLQWIAGLNTGIKEENKYVSKSMIYGVGDEYIGSWTKIPGTICNGFESYKQFQFTEPKAITDGPWVFTNEGWITHSGGWLSALSRLK